MGAVAGPLGCVPEYLAQQVFVEGSPPSAVVEGSPPSAVVESAPLAFSEVGSEGPEVSSAMDSVQLDR